MTEQKYDLRQHEVNKGDLVLLVNLGFSPFPPDFKATEPQITLTTFDSFRPLKNEHENYFMGRNTYFIRPPVEIAPGVLAPLVEKGNDFSYLFANADRIYVGDKDVESGLRDDPLVKQRLYPVQRSKAPKVIEKMPKMQKNNL